MDKVLYWIIYGFVFIISLIPSPVIYLISELFWIILMICPPLRYRKKIVRKNLADSFPEKSRKELRQIERRFYRYFLDQIFETLKLATISPEKMKKRMYLPDEEKEKIMQDYREGKSAIIYLGHMGNWEWMSSMALNFLDSDLYFCQIYHPLENKAFDKVMLKLRGRFGITSVPMAQTLRHLLKQKSDGKQFIVGMIADQSPLWWNIHYWTPFLNHKTPVFTGSEKIIRKLKIKSYYGHFDRVSRGHYKLTLSVISEDSTDMPEWGITEKYMRLLEENIRETPYIWLWSHNRWKRTWEGYQHWLKNQLRSTNRDDEKE